MKDAHIHAWQARVKGHRGRLRERFLQHGIESFTDSDVIELLLTFGTPRQDCKERARALLMRFGSLHAVLEAPIEELQKVRGIGPKNAIALKFVHAVARRFLRDRILNRPLIQCAKDVVDYLFHHLSLKDREFFLGVFLDTANQVIDIKELFSGTIDRAPIYPREVIKTALDLGAKGVILVHNHPSGHTSPSKQDIRATKQIMLGASALGLNVLDHIIIGSIGEYFSFDEGGLMLRLKQETNEVFNAL